MYMRDVLHLSRKGAAVFSVNLRRATKIIQKLRDISYEISLRECDLTTLETRRLRGDQIKMLKILNGYEDIDRNNVFSVKEKRRTRGRGATLAKKQCRLDIRTFFIERLDTR